MMHYSREDACRAWLTCGLLRASALSSIMQDFSGAEAVYDRFMTQGSGSLKAYGLSQGQITRLRNAAPKAAMHEMLTTMQKYDIGIISWEDPAYPDYLRNISDPPVYLYYRGNLDCLVGRCLTVIGSRNASPYGIDYT